MRDVRVTFMLHIIYTYDIDAVILTYVPLLLSVKIRFGGVGWAILPVFDHDRLHDAVDGRVVVDIVFDTLVIVRHVGLREIKEEARSTVDDNDAKKNNEERKGLLYILGDTVLLRERYPIGASHRVRPRR